jgi:hypothetical protein
MEDEVKEKVLFVNHLTMPQEVRQGKRAGFPCAIQCVSGVRNRKYRVAELTVTLERREDD